MRFRHRLGAACALGANGGTGRDEVLRQLFFRTARRFTPALAAETDYGLLYVPTSDSYVGASVFATGGRDAGDLGAALGVVDRWRGTPARRTIVEIGANIGSTTVPAVRTHHFDRVVAIEPFPANVELLRLNLAVNDVAGRATVVAAALSDRDGVMPLQVAPDNSGDNRLVAGAAASRPGAYGEERRPTIDVRTARFDTLVAEGVIELDEVDCVWIDVQGHEAQVLAGAATLVEARIPVVVELWPYGLRRAGGLERFAEFVAGAYERIVDLDFHGHGVPRELPATAVLEIAARLDGVANTDLVLLPPAPPG